MISVLGIFFEGNIAVFIWVVVWCCGWFFGCFLFFGFEIGVFRFRKKVYIVYVDIRFAVYTGNSK